MKIYKLEDFQKGEVVYHKTQLGIRFVVFTKLDQNRNVVLKRFDPHKDEEITYQFDPAFLIKEEDLA